MIAVVQRVLRAQVTVDGRSVGQIGHGMVLLAAVCKDDASADVAWMAGKLASLRMFRDGAKHFERDVRQAGGSVLLVSNFTVAAQTRYGRRPSLEAAADGQRGRELFDALVEAVRNSGATVQTGSFGADMQVELVNDGPVTFLLDSRQARPDAS